MNTLLLFPRSLLFISSALLFAGIGHAADTAFWLWGKLPALEPGQREELRRQGTRVLYRQVANVDGKRMPGSVVAGRSEFASDGADFTLVPVIRVESREVPTAAYFADLRRAFPVLQGTQLQVDFDCPDRLLGEYAALLRDLRETWPELGITALAHWPAVKDFPGLARSVREICPMFYDLQRDPTGVGPQNLPPPMLDPAQVAPLLEKWKDCPTPWRAGLPIFTRVTIFDSTGLSRGQIFGWEWPELVFNPQLRSEKPGALGVQMFRVAEPMRVARRVLEAGEYVTARQTDPAALAQCRAAALKAGARGVALFSFPNGFDSTLSLRSLAEGSSGTPSLAARLAGDQLVIENQSVADLLPRLAGERHDRDRGHTLEVDAPAPYFREAEPGDFHRVSAHAAPESEPRVVPVSAATRLTFWISHLDAGGALRSGLFQLAPHADASRVRWRLNGGAWKPLVSP